MANPNIVDFYMATVTFVDSERNELVQRGDLVRASHPLRKRYPAFFQRAADHVRPDIEQATAAPGEHR